MEIKAFDEFGFMLWYHAPIAYHLFLESKLSKTYGKYGSSSVFYFSENHEESKKHNNNLFKYRMDCYGFNKPFFAKNTWTPPPLKKHYRKDIFKFHKTILTINNKNNKEWGNSGIFNYFNKSSLEEIIKTFKDTHEIIYIRPPDQESYGYRKDDNQNYIDIGDLEIIRKHNVKWICDMLDKNKNLSYNELQFMILANSEKHITPSGDAVIPSYFGGDVLIYNCKNCQSSSRGVWQTNSWLKELSGSKIYGFNDYDKLINKSLELWK